MKVTSHIVVALLLVVPAASLCADEPDATNQRRRGPRLPLMAALDSDADGQISADEIANASAALSSLDKDDDGALNLEEMLGDRAQRIARLRERQGGEKAQDEFGPLAQRRDRRPGGGEGRARGGRDFGQRFKSLDQNGDGALSADEIPERMQRILGRFDTDGDGALSADELEDMKAAVKSRREGRRPQPRDAQSDGDSDVLVD